MVAIRSPEPAPQADARPNEPTSAAPIYWPAPPCASYPAPSDLAPPVACVIKGVDGQAQRGQLLALDFGDRFIEVQFTAAAAPDRLRFDQFLTLTLAERLTPKEPPRPASTEVTSLLERRPRTPYRLLLKGGFSMTGESIGHIVNAAGLFLFPPVDEADRVLCMFLPKEACLHQELGAPIGEVLVEQRSASAEQVEQAAQLQEELRSRKLGEMLVKQRIVTAEDLLKALELQTRMPVMRLGEALIALGLVSPDQLRAALELQKADRSTPLGELLVRQQLVTREALRTALARKMGFPIVDAANFPVESGALQSVPYAVAKRLRVLPLVRGDTFLVVAIEDVTRRLALDELEFLVQTKVIPALTAEGDFDQALSRVYARNGGEGVAPVPGAAQAGDQEGPRDVGSLAQSLERDSSDEAGRAEDKPIEQSDNSLVRLIHQMIVEAHAEGVSDIHIECSPGREKVKVRFRKDGQLRSYIEVPHNYRNAIVSRIKIMCDLDISERRKPQDGKINFARFSPQHKLELRVATLPTSHGCEDVTLRLLSAGGPVGLTQLGMTAANLGRLKSLVERPYGLVLCAGPTGSGKTTTLHAALAHINRPERKILTAEDPVEITQAGLRQVQVNPRIDWTFARALRAFLRSDPDVIMVGEVRDQETAQMVVEASLTGHLVLSTLHTNSASETVTRLLDMKVDAFNFADSLLGVLAQRLVRRLCPHCRAARPATAEEVDELLSDYLNAIPPDAPRPTRDELLAGWRQAHSRDGQLVAWRATGCERCGGSGMQGRLGIHELMTADRDLRRLILARAAPIELLASAMRGGMRTLRQDGIEKVLQGLTTIEEVRATSNEQ